MEFRNTSRYSTTTRKFGELDEREPSFVKRNIVNPINSFVGIFRNRYNYSYASGIFELPLPEQYHVTGSGKASEFNKAYQFMHTTLNMFDFAIANSAKWVVFIEPENESYLKSSLKTVKTLERTINDSDAWQFDQEQENLTGEIAQKTIGCIFAIGVSQVGETLGVNSSGGIDSGIVNGFTKSVITTGRADSNTLEITAKETNNSYTDMFIRPWIILSGHKGLHARKKSESIKATVRVFQMADTDPYNSPVVNKVFTYHNCVPINIGGETLSYATPTAVQRQITFTYNYYTVRTLKSDIMPPQEDYIGGGKEVIASGK